MLSSHFTLRLWFSVIVFVFKIMFGSLPSFIMYGLPVIFSQLADIESIFASPVKLGCKNMVRGIKEAIFWSTLLGVTSTELSVKKFGVTLVSITYTVTAVDDSALFPAPSIAITLTA